MRIVVKPGGLVVLFALAGVGTFFVVSKMRPVPAAVASAAPASMTKSNKPAKIELPSFGGSKVIDPSQHKWSLATQPPAVATMNLFMAKDIPGHSDKHALHLNVTAVDANKYWSAQLLKTVPQEVKANRKLAVRFWGRSTTKTPVYIVFEEGVSPHAAELNKLVQLTGDWQEYQFPFNTTKDHSDIHANFCVKAGIKPGQIEISDMRVEDLGPAS